MVEGRKRAQGRSGGTMEEEGEGKGKGGKGGQKNRKISMDKGREGRRGEEMGKQGWIG